MYSAVGFFHLFIVKLLLAQVVLSEIISFKNGETIYEYNNTEYRGQGAYCEVYEGKRIEGETTDVVAFKVARIDRRYLGTLAVSHESKIFKKISDHKSIPKFYEYFLEHNERATLVTQLLGNDLYKFLMKFKRFSTATVMRIGLQALDALEHIHGHNVIHYDLHMKNLAVGSNNDSEIYLFDFNMSKEYEIRNGSILIIENIVNKRPNAVKSPRNDLISLSYTLVKFFREYIPLHFIDSLWKRSFATIYTNEELDRYFAKVECKGALKKFFQMAKDPKHNLPDYEAFRNVLITELKKHKHSPYYNKFEWQ